jgi:hypothetical protein
LILVEIKAYPYLRFSHQVHLSDLFVEGYKNSQFKLLTNEC